MIYSTHELLHYHAHVIILTMQFVGETFRFWALFPSGDTLFNLGIANAMVVTV